MKINTYDSLSDPMATATEFTLPLSFTDGDAASPLLTRIAAKVGTTRIEIESFLQVQFAKIHSEKVRIFLGILQSLVPYSIITMGDRGWIVLKREVVFAEPTGFPNCILLPWMLGETTGCVNSEFQISDPDTQEFLTFFGGLSLSVPPEHSYCLETSELHPIGKGWNDVVDLGEWTESSGLYLPGNGDVILLKSDGAIGYWSHELASCDVGDDAISYKIGTIIKDFCADIQSNGALTDNLETPSSGVECLQKTIVEVISDEIRSAWRAELG